MTKQELEFRVSGITSASEETKKRIIDRFHHYRTCSDDELLDSCIIVEGMESGANSLRADIKWLQGQLLDAKNALTIMTKTTRDMRFAQKSFHKSKKGSADWNKFLRESTMLEAECDKFLKASWIPQPPPETNLFS